MIPVCSPVLTGFELQEIQKCLEAIELSGTSKTVDKFEELCASVFTMKYGVAVCNGTAAIETALYAIGVKNGDEVIIPSFTIISVALACLRIGAIPVVVDVGDDLNINPNLIHNALSSKTKALIAVNTYGNMCDYYELNKVCNENNIILIEDFSESIGSVYKNSYCSSSGIHGQVSITSLYANKLITTGEGGLILTNDEIIMKRAKNYRNLCFSNTDRYNHEDVGFNFRMSGLQAAFGMGQLQKLDKAIEIKRTNGELYKKLFEESNVKFLSNNSHTIITYWMYCIQINNPERLSEGLHSLKTNYGIDTRRFFKGLHSQQCLEGKIRLSGTHEVTERAYNTGCYLPSGLNLTKEQIKYVAASVKEVFYE